jgi:hypothetical protein
MARAGARFVQALHEAYAAADRAREVERLRLSLWSLKRPLSTGTCWHVSARPEQVPPHKEPNDPGDADRGLPHGGHGTHDARHHDVR